MKYETLFGALAQYLCLQPSPHGTLARRSQVRHFYYIETALGQHAMLGIAYNTVTLNHSCQHITQVFNVMTV